jgi:tetratricopeptide (TPR) repeat protein
MPTESEQPIRSQRISLLQKALIGGVALSAALLTYSLIISQFGPKTPLQADAAQPPPLTAEANQLSTPQKGANQPVTQPSGSPVAKTELVSATRPGEAMTASAPTSETPGRSRETEAAAEPLSLQLAEGYYTSKDYDKAYDAYERLRQNLAAQNFELVRDFLQFRMALCLEKKADFDKANRLFKEVSESRSIALRAIANYHSSLLEMNSGQYLKARTRAYKAIALTGALAFDSEWALALERDCHFLVAEAVTRQVLSLCDADKELPQQLWSHPAEKEPLTGLNESELQKVLDFGIERLNSGLLAPQVQAAESSGTLSRWSVVCNGPGIGELMARFATNAALDVKWVRHTDAAGNLQQGAGWNRPVTLYLPAATTQQVAATVAGTAGLLAQVDDTNTITITDPAAYSSLSEHTRLLNEHAIWLWRKLLLTYSDDQRIPNVHFVLGILQGQKGQVAEAIAEYKLVANRYPHTPLVPFALLRSSRIKTDLRDYTGASGDLKQLIEQYPDNELIGQAHIDLAETTMKAGSYDRACSLYRKAYTLGSSTESKTIAAFGAGRCFYQMNDYESAVKWLTLYIEAVRAQQHPAQTAAKQGPQGGANLYTAYLLLGKANLALGNLQQACDALERTAKRAAASDEYLEAISSLVEAQIKQENFVAALGTIENIRAWPFSQEQVTRLLLLKSKVLRTIGLTDQAVTLLSDRAQYLTDQQLKANVILELARCNIAAKNFDLASAHLTEVLSMVEPGPVSQQASLELAYVCMKLGEHQQTISICKKLLDSSACEQIKQQASKILASVYSKQENYDKAALALLTTSALPDTTKQTTGGDNAGRGDQ